MLRTRIKACFYFAKELLIINLFVSLFIALVGWASAYGFWPVLCLSLVTGGAFLSGYFYERQHSQQLYFFYNLGLSRKILYAAALLLDALTAALLLLIKNLVQ